MKLCAKASVAYQPLYHEGDKSRKCNRYLDKQTYRQNEKLKHNKNGRKWNEEEEEKETKAE